MNTPAQPSPASLLGLMAAALISLILGAVAGTFSLPGTVLASATLGLAAMIAVSVRVGNTTTTPTALLVVSVGIVCVPLGAAVTVLAR